MSISACAASGNSSRVPWPSVDVDDCGNRYFGGRQIGLLEAMGRPLQCRRIPLAVVADSLYRLFALCCVRRYRDIFPHVPKWCTGKYYQTRLDLNALFFRRSRSLLNAPPLARTWRVDKHNDAHCHVWLFRDVGALAEPRRGRSCFHDNGTIGKRGPTYQALAPGGRREIPDNNASTSRFVWPQRSALKAKCSKIDHRKPIK